MAPMSDRADSQRASRTDHESGPGSPGNPSESPARTQVSVAASREELAEAERRVRAYLRSLGLLEPADQTPFVAAALEAAQGEEDSGGDDGDLPDRALRRVMETAGQWMDHLAAAAGVVDTAGLRAQLPWYLRHVLREHPEAFGRRTELPEALRQAIARAALPVLPPPCPTVMKRQSLGQLLDFWLRLRGSASQAWQSLRSVLGEKRE